MHRRDGFTLLEIAVVIGLIAFLAAMAVPNLMAYQRRQDARLHAQRISNALGNARALSLKEGNPYLVLFDTGGTVQIVDDDDGDWQIDAGELTTDIDYAAGSDPSVTYYNALASPPTAVTVPEDGGGPIPAEGASFPIDIATGFPAVAFDPQGFPVSLPAIVAGPPGGVGSGAGSYYVTDNDSVTYSVTLLPLGGTRVRVFRSTLGDWF